MYNKIKSGAIKTLFLDIGGVLLTDGWGHIAQARAVKKFGLNEEDLTKRHHLIFNTYELGKLTLDEYLNFVIFYQQREFSPEDFKAFMFQQSLALEGHIDFFKEFKQQHQLKVIAVSNEGRELNEYRITQFGLDNLFDAFISSCYLHLQKPDKEMFKLACDVSRTAPEHVLYIDDNPIFIEVANAIGIPALLFDGLDKTKEFIKTCTFYKQ